MNKFLHLQEYGWCEIQIGDFKSRASYLTDVPIDCLEAAIQYIDYHQPIELHFDAEGWDVYVTGYDQNTLIRHTRTNSSEMEHIVLDDVNALDLAKQIYADIAYDIEGWTDFLFTFDDMERQKHLHEIERLVQELKAALRRGM